MKFVDEIKVNYKFHLNSTKYHNDCFDAQYSVFRCSCIQTVCLFQMELYYKLFVCFAYKLLVKQLHPRTVSKQLSWYFIKIKWK